MKIKKDHIFTVFIIAILISPYLLAFLNAPQLNFKLDRSWAWPLVAGLKQASLSALVSLLFGALLASSLFSCRTQKSYGRIKMILLAPNFIPPLFIILSVMSLSGALSISHQGLTWVVVTHSLMNGGLVAVALSSYFLQNVKKSWEVARVLGANPFDRLVRLWVPMMLPVLKQNFVLVFALCLVSFSIPLVIGGASVTSLEVHIFQLIRSEGNWGLALSYSLIQSVLVLFLAYLLWRLDPPQENALSQDSIVSGLPRGLIFLSFIPLLLLAGIWIFDSLTQALTLFGDNLFQSFVLSPLFLDAAINSGLIFLFVFLMQIFFSMGVLSGGRTSPLEAFFQGYLAPSVAVLGFTMSMLPGEGEIWLLIKSSICFSLLTFPLLFRWQVLSTWKDLSAQLQVARSLGASGSVLFWEISWPQLKGAVLQMSLVAAVWSLGDFAVTSFFFSGGKTMALIIVDLLNKYRMEWASFLSFLLFIFGLLTFYAFQRIFTHVRD